MQVEILEPVEYTYRGYETASWWTKYLLEPGTYEVEAWSNISYYFHFRCPATIIADHFPSTFAGNPMSSPGYDQNQNAGKQANVWVPFTAGFSQKDDWVEKYEAHWDGKVKVIL